MLGLLALFFGLGALFSPNPPMLAIALLLVGSNFLVGAGIIDAVDKLRPKAKPENAGPSGENV